MYELENRTPASMQSSWTDSAGYLYFEIHYPNGFVQIDCRADNAALTYKIGDMTSSSSASSPITGTERIPNPPVTTDTGR
jgi:hypothetical protein